MADPTRTNVATGTSSSASVTATFGFTATSGRLLVLTVGADDYKTGDPSGWTLSTGMSQQTNLGAYLWWKISNGTETSVAYTIGSATSSAWAVQEWNNIDATPYDTSAGQLNATSGTTYTTPSITPTTGRRLLIAHMGGSATSNFTGLSTWTNSFTEETDVANNAAATKDISGTASRIVDGDGATSFSSGATYSTTWDTVTGQIIAFKVAAGGSSSRQSLLLSGVGR